MSRDTKILIGIGVLIVLVIAWFGIKDLGAQNEWVCSDGEWIKKGNPSAEKPTTGCGQQAEINDFASCVEAGNEILKTNPLSCKTPEGKVFIESISGQNLSDLIKVTSPQPNQSVSSPLSVTGQARGTWFFEASFPVRLIDGNGNTLVQTAAQAQGEWMTENFVPFSTVLNFNQPRTSTGTLVLEKDNPSGLPANAQELRIPVRFETATSTGKLNINIYFNNEEMDPEFSCNKVFPVRREISATSTIARAALEELIKGPTQMEINEKYFTNINSGVKVNNVSIDRDGVATADFNDQLDYQVGGSCRVSAIRSQITQTLKQFPAVKSVVISINGRTEDILQP